MRANEARQLLENHLIQEAAGAAEADIVAQMKTCKLDDKDAHTRLVMALQVSGVVQRYLWKVMQDGVTASEQIQLRGRRLD